MNGELHALFPTPIYKVNIRPLGYEELQCLNELEMCDQTLGNRVSTNTHILDEPRLNSFKLALEEIINQYAKSLLHIDNHNFYITNSWLNSTDTNQQHIIHNHSNSIFSGVYYIDVEDTVPLITFNRMQPPFLLNFIPKEFTIFNAMEWSIPVENNSLIIFPSTLYHYVKPNLQKKTRVSIVFNSFVKGNIGHTNGSELKL